jgi:hypothetical protein
MTFELARRFPKKMQVAPGGQEFFWISSQLPKVLQVVGVGSWADMTNREESAPSKLILQLVTARSGTSISDSTSMKTL